MPPENVIAWMSGSDPALRWQVERDVASLPPQTWQATRARVAAEGFGERLLSLQEPDGQWAGGAFFPADLERGEIERSGQPWTATTWTLNSLREWGIDAEALLARNTVELLAQNCRWEYESLPYWGGEVDCCINSWTLANGVWLGADVDGIADWFVEHRLADCGWNCEWENGSTRSSFHSTLNSLKGLLALEIAGRGTDATRAARRSGEEYLLQRRLLHRLTTGRDVGPWVENLTYPFRWCYSVLNAADYFRQATPFRPDGARHPPSRRNGAYSFCPTGRRELAPGRTPPGPGLVRRRRPRRRAVEMVDADRNSSTDVVGRCGPGMNPLTTVSKLRCMAAAGASWSEWAIRCAERRELTQYPCTFS